MILISKHFTILFLRSFSFDGEDIQTLETVFDFFSKHIEVRQKTPLRVVFAALFSVFGNVLKHGLEYLIYYFQN